uniref:Uncharacterized protein n=1 Tax=Mycena chlorophos TaxID=658473 RepID=A0ABQ0LP41_MYCCL|nr:predicted protein [Mycena chlorophos]
MYASLVRRSMHGLVPPKIATPKLVSGDSAGPLGPLVSFYSKLPKGPAPVKASGIKGRWFRGKNASAKPVLVLIGGLTPQEPRALDAEQALDSVEDTTDPSSLSCTLEYQCHSLRTPSHVRRPRPSFFPFSRYRASRPSAVLTAYVGLVPSPLTADGRRACKASREEAEEPLNAGILVATIHKGTNARRLRRPRAVVVVIPARRNSRHALDNGHAGTVFSLRGAILRPVEESRVFSACRTTT